MFPTFGRMPEKELLFAVSSYPFPPSQAFAETPGSSFSGEVQLPAADSGRRKKRLSDACYDFQTSTIVNSAASEQKLLLCSPRKGLVWAVQKPAVSDGIPTTDCPDPENAERAEELEVQTGPCVGVLGRLDFPT